MPRFEQWRNHKDIYCVVDNNVIVPRFTFSEKGIVSCILPDGQTISVGDKLNGRTVQAIQTNSGAIMVMTD